MRTEAVRGVRFLDELRGAYADARMMDVHHLMRREELIQTRDGRLVVPRQHEAHKYISYVDYLDTLDDPNTKRLLFDAEQASQFDEILDAGAEPVRDIRENVRPPFHQLYCEFTSPIYLSENEPGHEDYARAFIWRPSSMGIKMADPVRLKERAEAGGDPRPLPEDYLDIPVAEVAFFLTESAYDDNARPDDAPNAARAGRMRERSTNYVDRTFKMHLGTGMCFIPARSARDEDGGDPSEVPTVNDAKTGEERELDDEEYFVCGQGPRGRKLGWWERTVEHYGNLVTYIFAYTSAKSIRVVEAPLTRQERRWHHRNPDKLPKPWHVIEVDPKFYRPGRDDEGDPSRRHSYRYDVIGHFRAGRYRRKDGTYAHHWSWVAPHQRGLANDVYIPATHNVRGGKAISPAMREIYNHAEELGVPPPEDQAVSITEPRESDASAG